MEDQKQIPEMPPVPTAENLAASYKTLQAKWVELINKLDNPNLPAKTIIELTTEIQKTEQARSVIINLINLGKQIQEAKSKIIKVPGAGGMIN